jgi:hypothetical protein
MQCSPPKADTSRRDIGARRRRTLQLKDGHAMPHDPQVYTRTEVVERGFEARCVDVDGARYLWHGASGLRVDPRTHVTTLIMNPEKLPEGPWTATELGEEELREE